MMVPLVLLFVNQENKNLPFYNGKSGKNLICRLLLLSLWFCLGFHWQSVVWRGYPKTILTFYSWFPKQGTSIVQGLSLSQWEGLRWDPCSTRALQPWDNLILGSWLSRIPPKRKTISRLISAHVDYPSLQWQSDYPNYLWNGDTTGTMSPGSLYGWKEWYSSGLLSSLANPCSFSARLSSTPLGSWQTHDGLTHVSEC